MRNDIFHVKSVIDGSSRVYAEIGITNFSSVIGQYGNPLAELVVQLFWASNSGNY